MSNSAVPGTGQAFWQDRAAQATLGLAIVLNIALFALVLLTHDQVAEAIAAGTAGPDARFSSPSSALVLPIIGLVSWLSAGALGLFYYNKREQAAIAYTIWGAVALIELVTWVPVLNLIISS